MLRTFFFIALTIALTEFAEAQIRAKTEEGKTVLLFEDGTWKFEEKAKTSEETPSMETTAIIIPAVAVDSSREITTKPAELFYLISPRLERYFGASGGKIRCKYSCSNNQGSIIIQLIWEIPVSDGNRYFGTFKEGTKVVFTTTDDQQVELMMGAENKFESLEKHNYSMISNSSFPLTQDQLEILTTRPIRKMEVDWKKKPEEYDVENTRFLVDSFPAIL